MPEIAVTSLDPRQQKLIDNARIALERGQLDYTLDACARHPELSDLGAWLRRLALPRLAAANDRARIASTLRSAP